jgi:hypothetical protein
MTIRRYETSILKRIICNYFEMTPAIVVNNRRLRLLDSIVMVAAPSPLKMRGFSALRELNTNAFEEGCKQANTLRVGSPTNQKSWITFLRQRVPS